MPQLSDDIQRVGSGLDARSFLHTVRTTLAAVGALLVARACGAPESYWAVVTTVVVMQSATGAAWDTSWHRLAGAFVGGLVAAVLVMQSWPDLFTLAAGMLCLGPICTVLRLGNSGYRFAGVTLAVIVLVHRVDPVWTIALHRVMETAIGIMVAMAVMAVWREGQRAESQSQVNRHRGPLIHAKSGRADAAVPQQPVASGVRGD